MVDRCMRTDSLSCDPSRITLDLQSLVIWLGSQLEESFFTHLSTIRFSLSLFFYQPRHVVFASWLPSQSIFVQRRESSCLTILPNIICQHETTSPLTLKHSPHPLPNIFINWNCFSIKYWKSTKCGKQVMNKRMVKPNKTLAVICWLRYT